MPPVAQAYSEVSPGVLRWPDLITGTLLRRYKRFLADVRLTNGQTVTAHCPNSGAMESCCQPGCPVYISHQDNPKRKLEYTWEMIRMPGSLVGVNTMVPNRLVAAGVMAGHVLELAGYTGCRREVVVGGRSRLDLLFEKPNGESCYVEVKNSTLVRGDTAMFPDARTERGRKHLAALVKLKAEGYRCAMFYLIQRMDARRFRPADEIDPEYGQALREAAEAGVEMLAYDVRMDLETISLNKPVPIGID